MIRIGVAAVMAVLWMGATLSSASAGVLEGPAAHVPLVKGANYWFAQASPTQPAPEGQAKERPAPQRRPATPPVKSRDGEPAQIAECAWVGKRIVSLLTRDDAMTAGDFLPFYLRFGCPEGHVGKSFGCVVRNGEAAPNDILAERIEKCWIDPAIVFPPLPPKTAKDNGSETGGAENTQQPGSNQRQ